MSFHVGQKVVRVKTEGGGKPYVKPHAREAGEMTQLGVIYEVRWAGTHRFLMHDGTIKEGVPACRVVGVMRRTITSDGVIRDDVPFAQCLFRPLQEEKKEEKLSAAMEIFRRIAANPKMPIREDA